MTKKCKGPCSEIKPVETFGIKTSAKDKLQSYCKPCKKTIDKEYRHKNKDKRAKHYSKYYKKNKEAIDTRIAIWTIENSSRVKRVSEEWRNNNKGLKNALIASKNRTEIRLTYS